MLLVQFSAEKEAERALDPPPPHPPQTCIATRCHHSLQRGRQERWKSAPLFHEVTFVSQLLSDTGEDDEFWMNQKR